MYDTLNVHCVQVLIMHPTYSPPSSFWIFENLSSFFVNYKWEYELSSLIPRNLFLLRWSIKKQAIFFNTSELIRFLAQGRLGAFRNPEIRPWRFGLAINVGEYDYTSISTKMRYAKLQKKLVVRTFKNCQQNPKLIPRFTKIIFSRTFP